MVMAFSEPFAIVKEAATASAATPLTTPLENKWRERFYVSCRSTPKLDPVNLVFCGIGHKAALPSHIPLRLTANGIEIGGKRYAGTDPKLRGRLPECRKP